MKKTFFSIIRFTLLFTAIFFALTGCSSGSKNVRSLQKDGSFVFNENIPYGTSWEDAIGYYGTDLDKLEAWQYSTGDSPFFQPEQTVKLDNIEWQQGLFFNGEMEFTQGTYQCSLSNPDDMEKIVQQLYGAYGSGQMTQEEFFGYLDGLNRARLSDYWVAEDGSCLLLLIFGNGEQYTVSILCSENADGAYSGCEEISFSKPG